MKRIIMHQQKLNDYGKFLKKLTSINEPISHILEELSYNYKIIISRIDDYTVCVKLCNNRGKPKYALKGDDIEFIVKALYLDFLERNE